MDLFRERVDYTVEAEKQGFVLEPLFRVTLGVPLIRVTKLYKDRVYNLIRNEVCFAYCCDL